MKRTAEMIKDLTGCFQSSALRTKHLAPLFPSSELLGYFQSSANADSFGQGQFKL